MSIATSGYSKQRSSNVAGRALYSDLDLNLNLHPVKMDISPVTDVRAVRNSVKNLVLTNFGERPFQPKLGSNVTALLFENTDQFTAIMMKKEIYRLLEDHEPGINAIRVEILDDTDANAYRVSIEFNVIKINAQAEVEFALQRLR
jgi:phage baseplate assembly protein W